MLTALDKSDKRKKLKENKSPHYFVKRQNGVIPTGPGSIALLNPRSRQLSAYCFLPSSPLPVSLKAGGEIFPGVGVLCCSELSRAPRSTSSESRMRLSAV